MLATRKSLGYKIYQLMVFWGDWDVMLVSVFQIVIAKESMWVVVVNLL
jgi:hypothetical protein